MTAVNIVDLKVDEKAHSYAKIYASLLKDEFQRKRAYASIVALQALIEELEKTDNDVQKTSTLFRNPILNEEYEISDIYINNWHIDVRIVTDGDAFLVPKSHFDNDIAPDFYAVIKVNNNLSKAELLGFADTALMEKQAFGNRYYSVLLAKLISYDEFLVKINNTKVTSFSEQEHEFFRASYLSLMDEELNTETKKRLLKHLFECSHCRSEFSCFTGFELVSCNTTKYPELLDDQTLNIIGAQAVDSEQYKGKEETINISDEEIDDNDNIMNTPVTYTPSQEEIIVEEKIEDEIEEEPIKEVEKEEITEQAEETVSDILDELFNIDEGFIDTTVPEKTEVEAQITQIQNEAIKEDTSNEDITKQEETAVIKTSESGELEIIEDNSELELEENEEEKESLEVLKEDEDETQDLQIAYEAAIEINNPDKDEVIIVDTDEEDDLTETVVEIKEKDTVSEELQLIEDEPSQELIDEINSVQEDTIQQVIVDYDEYGEPIYSYVNNVIQPETLEETQPTEEEFEQYPQEYEEVENEELSDNEIISLEATEEEENNKETSIEDVRNGVVEKLASVSVDDVELEDETTEVDDYKEIDDDILDNTDEEFETVEDEVEDIDDSFIDNDEVEDDLENEEDIDNEDTDEEVFEDEEGIDEDEEEKPSSKKGLIFLILIVLGLAAAGCTLFLMKKPNQVEVAQTPDNTVETTVQPQNEAPQIADMFQASEEGIGLEVDNQNNELPPPPPTIETPQQTNQTIDKSTALANAFSPSANTVVLRDTKWFCAQKLYMDDTFKNYLKTLDELVTLNLRKNILDVTETPQSNSVTVGISVLNDGNLDRVAITESSGSQQVDNIVLQSINESFVGEKSPIFNDGELKADKYILKLVIKL